LSKIKTRQELKSYVLRQLGAPLISIEVDPSQLEDIISDTIQKFSFKAMAGEDVKTILFNVDAGVREYTLDDRVQSVLALRHTSSFGTSLTVGGGYVLDASYFVGSNQLSALNLLNLSSMAPVMAQLATIEAMFDVPLAYDFNYNTKILRFYQDIPANKLMLKVSLEYEPLEYDNIYNNPWIKSYAIAKTKNMWGQNVGKFSSTLVSGSTINYDRLISESQAEIEKLDDELENTYSVPLGMWVF
jgi:hypothetical protein